jgi:hypothetical protein
LPPEQPRIKYLQSIYAEDDIGRVYSFFEKLFGKEYDDRLVRPYGVYARGNLLFVTDLMKRAVLVFDMTAKRLSVVGGDGSIMSPAAAVRDAAGNVYVADSGSDRGPTVRRMSSKTASPSPLRSMTPLDGCM